MLLNEPTRRLACLARCHRCSPAVELLISPLSKVADAGRTFFLGAELAGSRARAIVVFPFCRKCNSIFGEQQATSDTLRGYVA